MDTTIYDVIIVGGGPVGVASAIELGLHGIKVLVLEKYETPLYSPRAQLLNSRTMEIMSRWGVGDILRKENMLQVSNAIWCSKLNGEVYSSIDMHEYHNNSSKEEVIHIPLWITEKVLRNRVSQINSVRMLTNFEVIRIKHTNKDLFEIVAKNRVTKENIVYQGSYVLACDGAKSTVREQLGIHLKSLAPSRQMTNILFKTTELPGKVTIDDAFLYFILESEHPGVIGPVDPNQNIWYSVFNYKNKTDKIEEQDISNILDSFCGQAFKKEIISTALWDMCIQVAMSYSFKNRVFLVGDSAHSFAPTGGLGLNTAIGDVTNLCWKLAYVIQNKLPAEILTSYEKERLAIGLNNLYAAERNAKSLVTTNNLISPEKQNNEFAKANAQIAKTHLLSAGIGMGYAYFSSPLISLKKGQSTEPMEQSTYTPRDLPGYFLPEAMNLNGVKSIYRILSAVDWTLIISGNSDSTSIKIKNVQILRLPENTYSSRYILIRPDWHIAYADNTIDFEAIEQLVTQQALVK
ncbi:FAD-dependent monooxygenase [Cysteiniphilum halobium]|uniref:FAD-dependent monooxygenase n=1 Tax=Cysteiniphilum halobium TaxID=2219059 RepID=UPI003F86E77F